MRFIVRPGSDPVARADAALLRALGLPGGGTVRLGSTHCRVAAGEVPSPTAILVGPRTMNNAGVSNGDSVDVQRAPLPEAFRVTVSDTDAPLDTRHLSRSLQGTPVTVGDKVAAQTSYGDGQGTREIELEVIAVTPRDACLVGSATVVSEVGETPRPVFSHPAGAIDGERPTTAEALLAGLDTELEVMTGWLSLLTSKQDLPKAWGLPRVAGVLLEGPAGCGKSELVAAAAAAAGAVVHEVSMELVFKPDKLLERLEKAAKTSTTPGVVFVDRLDAVVGDDAMFRTQVAAIMRWFLDAVAERSQMACVLGVSSVSKLPASVTTNPLLPRTLSIPPPDARRRELLFEAALASVPSETIEFAALAGRTAGFSGADVLAAVVHASAMIAPHGGALTQDALVRAIDETTPSMGTTGLGEMPSYGFERVANLDEVKQRLTEAVIWQMKEPERFSRLGIEPPRGLLLYGPPGTGKTFVVRALANESGAAFFTVKGAELLDKYVGESERAVREVFARARAVAPAILFFDEIDALAPVRGNSTNSVTDSVVAALLTEMDGVSERGDVFVIGANRRDLVDSALLRPGRLETHLHLGLPEPESRRAFLAISDVPFAGDVENERIIAETEGFSFADMSGLLREAALQALRRDSSAIAVTNDDIDFALERYRESRTGAPNAAGRPTSR
jgi:transitional endoplasmic reticulum ATPase